VFHCRVGAAQRFHRFPDFRDTGAYHDFNNLSGLFPPTVPCVDGKGCISHIWADGRYVVRSAERNGGASIRAAEGNEFRLLSRRHDKATPVQNRKLARKWAHREPRGARQFFSKSKRGSDLIVRGRGTFAFEICWADLLPGRGDAGDSPRKRLR